MEKIIILLALVLLVSPVMAGGPMHVAVGDSFAVPANPDYDQQRVWIFGQDIYITEYTSGSVYASDISSLDIGEYHMFVQYPGSNGMYDLNYKNDKISSIYVSVGERNLFNTDRETKPNLFNDIRSIQPCDDVFEEYTLYLESPDIRIVNMYSKLDGTLHIDASTNLARGDKIDAMIDEDVYGITSYRTMMSNSSVVREFQGGNGFSLEFKREAANQLTAGTHVIYVHFLEDGLTTLPIKRYTELVEPTPTPEIRHYFAFTGEELGYAVNTTRPVEPVVTWNLTRTTPETRLAAIHINNRTIMPRGDVYLGEKNLDISQTLGWQDPGTSGYNFRIQWCEGAEDDTTVVTYTVKDEYHFNVDDTFANRLGAWCQYQSNLKERDAPVAFYVWSGSGMNLIDPYYVEPTEEPTAEVTPTFAEYVEITPEPTPIPVPTTEAIVLPMSVWIGVLAVVVVVVMRR